MALKILSDFDGVWTNQAEEAREVLALMISRVAVLADVERARVEADFERFEALVLAQPEQHGWAPDGRITAYVDEDPFCVPNALATWLGKDEARALPETAVYREAILGSGQGLSDFGDRCFLDAGEALRQRGAPPMVAEAREVVDELAAAGAELVVVSNSSSAKILDAFRAIDVDARETPGGDLRVRGAAMKFKLGELGESLQLAGREVHVDRPLYRRAIEEESPDLLIGDVWSLDLALAAHMRAAGEPAAPRTLVLRQQAHTPAWVLDDRAAGAIDHLITDLSELPALVRALPTAAS